MDNLDCDIVNSSELILNRVDQIDASIISIANNLEQLVSAYGGDVKIRSIELSSIAFNFS